MLSSQDVFVVLEQCANNLLTEWTDTNVVIDQINAGAPIKAGSGLALIHVLGACSTCMMDINTDNMDNKKPVSYHVVGY